MKPKKAVKEAKSAAWNEYLTEINSFKNEALGLMQQLQAENQQNEFIAEQIKSVQNNKEPYKRDIISAFRKIMYFSADSSLKKQCISWLNNRAKKDFNDYSSHLYSQSEKSALNISSVAVQYDNETKWVDGREILRDNFDYIFNHKPETLIFGEDAGRLGDVNQGLEGLQAKYGELRIADTGIREATIIGQGIGMAMRGLRPIAEIQYLDYLLYGLQLMSDDLATVQYRTKGGQKAPLIVRTRGHRLEGIWHSGSPMGTIINALRGVYVCVPRNMTEAAGFYNTLMESDDCALVIEPLNGYRLKERKPENIGQFKTPLGIPEILQAGNDVTIVSYGSTIRIIQDAIQLLEKKNISVELIDIRTLLPFDINEIIKDSLQKTNKLVVIDEDVEGGATGFILQQIIDKQGAFRYLDASPLCISAKDHRPAYGSDGDYFSKPNAEDIFEKIYALMHEYAPKKYPAVF